METRGRKPNSFMALRVKEMRKEKKSTQEIAAETGLTAPMVRYYLRLPDTQQHEKRDSVASCFFRQPEAIQYEIARAIGYQMPKPLNSELLDKVVKDAIDAAIEQAFGDVEEIVHNGPVDESSLLGRCIAFLNGKIEPHEIDENFSHEEMKRLTCIEPFMNMTHEIFGAKKSKYTKEQTVEALRKAGIK